MIKALQDIRVLDLSRVLAGPFCTQMLGDLGAEVIKIERPEKGDDTRGWGPTFLQDENGDNTSESAYYLSCNRNKKSVAIDLSSEEGQALIKKMVAQSDVLIENFKVDGLKKYGLSYDDLKDENPHLIYCSITGFGQNGPMAHEPGYDFLAQAMTGLMACTGKADEEPMKVGVALSDVMTGLNAAVAILAALHARNTTGQGQHIDLALTDCTLASMVNIAQYYLTSGTPAQRRGNDHSSIVPYRAFKTKDGFIILAVGNDDQFARFAACAGHTEWAEDERFVKNSGRVEHRDILVPLIDDVMVTKTSAEWLELLHKNNVPCGPVHTMDQVFADPQIQARDMQIAMNHPYSIAPVSLVGSPLKLSDTPVSYESAPPVCGQHTEEILKNLLDLDAQDIAELQKKGIVDAASFGD